MKSIAHIQENCKKKTVVDSEIRVRVKTIWGKRGKIIATFFVKFTRCLRFPPSFYPFLFKYSRGGSSKYVQGDSLWTIGNILVG